MSIAFDVVAVDLDRVPAEGAQPSGVDVEIPLVARRAGLAEAVDVDDRDQVVEPVEAALGERLPHRALGHLAVAAQHPDSAVEALELLGRERHADADRQALAERAGGDIDPRQDRRRVTLEPAAAAAVGEELLFVDRADREQDRVVQRRRVALGEDQVIVVRRARVVDVAGAGTC